VRLAKFLGFPLEPSFLTRDQARLGGMETGRVSSICRAWIVIVPLTVRAQHGCAAGSDF